MYKILPVQEAYERKFRRQREVPGLQLSREGLCAHIGKISPGCFWCLSPTALSYGIQVGCDVALPDVCNLHCTYCFKRDPSPEASDHFRIPGHWELGEHTKSFILQRMLHARHVSGIGDFVSFAFSGDGAEPLLYMPVIRAYMKYYKNELEPALGLKAWYKLYTNGLLAGEEKLRELRDLGLTEIRFHLGATGFSEEVMENVRTAVKLINTVTVETPSWPLHRDKLMNALPYLDDIGVKHLNLIEVGVTKYNFASITSEYPQAEIYHSYIGLALDDGGLVYDLMREVLAKNYRFSVLDCNTFIRKVRDQVSYDAYFRDALRMAGYGSDWHDTGRVPGESP